MNLNINMKNQNTKPNTTVNTMISFIKKTQSKLTRLLLTLVMSALMSMSYAIEEITYYHNDALGSPVAATDEAGNVKWREEYLPYGERLLKQDGGTNDTWFTGKQEDKSNGLSYFGARWYDPVLGRFTGIDPVGFKQGNIQTFNRYAYANNNPYAFVDPDGNSAFFMQKGSSLDNQMRNNASGLALEVAVRTFQYGGEAVTSVGGVGTAVKQTGKGLVKGAKNLFGKQKNPNIKKVLDGIEENGFNVKVNPRNPATKQEGNVTIDFGDKTKVNLRVETHSLKQNGPSVRHANVEVTRQVKNKNKVISNKHIK